MRVERHFVPPLEAEIAPLIEAPVMRGCVHGAIIFPRGTNRIVGVRSWSEPMVLPCADRCETIPAHAIKRCS